MFSSPYGDWGLSNKTVRCPSQHKSTLWVVTHWTQMLQLHPRITTFVKGDYYHLEAQWLNSKTQKIFKHKKTFFTVKMLKHWNWLLRENSAVFSILGYIQNRTGCCPERSDLAEPDPSRGLEQAVSRGPCQPQQYCDLVIVRTEKCYLEWL